MAHRQAMPAETKSLTAVCRQIACVGPALNDPMKSPAATILPSIRTLPLPVEAQQLFSRAVNLMKQSPADFEPVGVWLDKHYCESRLRTMCERGHRHEMARRLEDLRKDSRAWNRRRELRRGRPLEELKEERIAEACSRGQRLKGTCVVTRSHPRARRDEKKICTKNVHLVWAWDDEQYRQRLRQLRQDRAAAKISEHDQPDQPTWRLRRALREIVEAGYPSDMPMEHAEQSRKMVGLATLLVWPEALPTLGELGRWEWQSRPDAEWEADPTDALDDLWRDTAAAPVQDGPHEIPLHLLNARHDGRGEVLFYRMPGGVRKLQDGVRDLTRFCELLSIAVDGLEAATSTERAEVETPKLPVGPKTTHSADFAFVNWFGTEYTFALGVQSAAVKALWIEWESSGLGLHQETIRNAVDSELDNFRLDKAFRNHKAFGTMIQSIGDGKYKLVPPTTATTKTVRTKKSAGIPAKARQKPR